MSEIRFDLDIQYPHQRALNRVWLGALIGGAVVGLPRFLIWYIYDVKLQRPYTFDAELLFGGGNGAWEGGQLAVVLIAAAMLFCWWRLTIWAVRNQLD